MTIVIAARPPGGKRSFIIEIRPEKGKEPALGYTCGSPDTAP
jgi:hypothetical protein